MHLTTENLKKMGKELCLALIINNNLSIINPVCQILTKNEALVQLENDKSLLFEDSDNENSSGSDSNPSDDNLDSSQMVKLLIAPKRKPKLMRNQQKSPIKRETLNTLSTKLKIPYTEPKKKCTICGEIEELSHTCIKPKFSVKLSINCVIKPIKSRDNSIKRSNFNATTNIFGFSTHRNSEGKSVRDQATQTIIPRKVESITKSLHYLDLGNLPSPNQKPEETKENESFEKFHNRKNSLPFIAKGKNFNFDKIKN